MKERPKICWDFEEDNMDFRRVEELDDWADKAEDKIKELKELLIKSERSLSSNFCGVLKREIKQALKDK